MVRRAGRRWGCSRRVGWKRSPFDRTALSRPSNRRAATLWSSSLLPLLDRSLFLGPSVVVCKLNSDFSGIFALAIEAVPAVALTSAR